MNQRILHIINLVDEKGSLLVCRCERAHPITMRRRAMIRREEKEVMNQTELSEVFRAINEQINLLSKMVDSAYHDCERQLFQPTVAPAVPPCKFKVGETVYVIDSAKHGDLHKFVVTAIEPLYDGWGLKNSNNYGVAEDGCCGEIEALGYVRDFLAEQAREYERKIKALMDSIPF